MRSTSQAAAEDRYNVVDFDWSHRQKVRFLTLFQVYDAYYNLAE